MGNPLKEEYHKVEGWIRIIEHKGEIKHTPWAIKDPSLWRKAQEDPLLKSRLNDPKFCVPDLSEADITREFEDHNLIVNQASVLMVQLMSPANTGLTAGSNGLNGIQYLAVGTGYGNGTQTNPQPEDASYTQLRQELARKPITSWTYLDANGNAVSTPPTGVGQLQLTTTFSASEAIGALVEMGLFGGNATTTANSGLMFNYKTFSVWNKTSALNSPLTIIWSLKF